MVSPHRDDAALSCAAVLDRGEPISVLTVFAGRPDPPVVGAWDTRCGFSSSDESWPARAAEERGAIGDSGHVLETGPLLEAQHLSGPRPESDARWIFRRLARWIADNPDGAVLAPVGAGWQRRTLTRPRRRGPRPHPDHLLLSRCALGASVEGGARFIFYEEYPYLHGGGSRTRARLAARHVGRRCHEFEVKIDRASKAHRIGAYESQLPHLLSAGRPDQPEVLPPLERYWCLPAS